MRTQSQGAQCGRRRGPCPRALRQQRNPTWLCVCLSSAIVLQVFAGLQGYFHHCSRRLPLPPSILLRNSKEQEWSIARGHLILGTH